MPALIAAVVAAMVLFYFKSKPAPVEAATVLVEESISTATPPEAKAPAAPPLIPPSETNRTLPLLARADVSDTDFTPWMSSLALDTYIRQKNRGYQGSFWSRGNWIRSIEGRWIGGGHEFRIALGTMARPGEIQWIYRLDLTELAFADELDRLGDDGFDLAQSQAYRHPDGSKRYQAVWQREETAKVAGR